MINYIVLNNVLHESEFDTCIKEIELHQNDITPRTILDSATFDRYYPPVNTAIPNIIEKVIFNKSIFDMSENFDDLCWKWFANGRANKFEVQVTRYKKESNHQYTWHTDHLTNQFRILNYILYMNTVTEGGELQILNKFTSTEVNLPHRTYSDEDILVKIKPERNKLVIIPSWYIHRVTPVISDVERLTINGHVGLGGVQ